MNYKVLALWVLTFLGVIFVPYFIASAIGVTVVVIYMGLFAVCLLGPPVMFVFVWAYIVIDEWLGENK